MNFLEVVILRKGYLEVDKMIKIRDEDLEKIKEVLGNLYLDNGNSEEVILLSQAVDKIMLAKQRSLYSEYVDNLY